MTDTLNTYSVLADAAADTIFSEIKAVQTGGHTASGDLGGGLYRRTASEPTLPGKFRSQDRYLPDGTTDAANGGWWALSESSVTLQMFGGEPGAYADAALTDAMAYADAENAEIVVCGVFKLANLNIIPHSFVLRGVTGHQVTGVGSNFQDGFECDAGAGIHVRNGASTVGRGRVMSLFLADSLSTVEPANRQSWDPVSLFELCKGATWTFSNLSIRGGNRRRYGLRVGAGYPAGCKCEDPDDCPDCIPGVIWNSTFTHVDARDCQIGAFIGGAGDSTDNNIIDCSFHHNKSIGVVFQNPIAGSMINSSAENNEGPVGVFVYSYGDRAKSFRIQSNYIFGNASETVDLEGSCGIMIGGEAPYTDFTTGGTNELESESVPWGIVVTSNYLANDSARYAVISSAERDSVISSNMPVSNTTTATADFRLLGDGTTTLADNRNQNTGSRNSVEAASGYREIVYRNGADGAISPGRSDLQLEADGSVLFGDGASLTSTRLAMGEDGSPRGRKHGAIETRQLAGTGNAWSPVFDPATDFPSNGHGIVKLLVAVEQTNNFRQAMYEIAYSSPLTDNTGATTVPAAYSIQFQSPDPDGTEWRIQDDVLEVRRSLNWQATVVATMAVAPFSG